MKLLVIPEINKRRKLNCCPSLVISIETWSIYTDNTLAYDTWKRLAATVSYQYRTYFDHYEMGNELDVVAIKSRASGVDMDDYDPVKIKIMAVY